MTVYSSLTREQSYRLARLLGYRVLDPNDPRIEEDWIAGVHYPTLDDLRRLNLMPNEIGFPTASSALETYIKLHGMPDDPEILRKLLYCNREE